LRPAAAGGERARPDGAHRGRPPERALHRARRRAGGDVSPHRGCCPGDVAGPAPRSAGSAAAPLGVPARLEAHEPPEARGLARDAVRMLVTAADGRVLDARARDLPRLLAPGDLLVINTSATLPAALPARRAD